MNKYHGSSEKGNIPPGLAEQSAPEGMFDSTESGEWAHS